MANRIIILGAIAALAIVSIAAYFFIFQPQSAPQPTSTSGTSTTASNPSGTPGTSGSQAITGDESAVLTDQINSLSDQQLANISADMGGFSASSDSGIASDTSQFLYTGG